MLKNKVKRPINRWASHNRWHVAVPATRQFEHFIPYKTVHSAGARKMALLQSQNKQNSQYLVLGSYEL